MVQWLRLCASTAAGAGSVPGQETMMSLPNNKKLKKKKVLCRRLLPLFDPHPHFFIPTFTPEKKGWASASCL